MVSPANAFTAVTVRDGDGGTWSFRVL